MSQHIRSHRDLDVWKKSVDLAVELYVVTRSFPRHERYGISSQIQRAGVSVPSNIAEGNAKSGAGHYLNHLSHSKGSLGELDTLLLISGRIGYLDEPRYVGLAKRADEIGRMLSGLADSVAASAGRSLRRHT